MNSTRALVFAFATPALLVAFGCAKKEAEPEAPPPAPTAEAEATPPPAPPATCPDPTPAALEATKAKIEQALAMEHRSEDNKARDQWRHPVETLQFFGLTDDMNVVELWAGGGWYTEVLAPVLKEKGSLLVTNYDATGEGPRAEFAKKLTEKLKGNDAFTMVREVVVAPPDTLAFGPDGKADMVLTFRNNHTWIGGGYEDKVYAAAFAALKPCGIFGVVQHRAKEGATEEQWKDKGYVPQDYLIKKIEAAGFELVDKSEINANPKDTADHEFGVWMLPPSLSAGDGGKKRTEKEKAPYLAIGESDRMTLKFRKPMAAN